MSLYEVIINCLPPPFGTLLIANNYKSKFRNMAYYYAAIGSVLGTVLGIAALSIGLEYLYSVSEFIKFYPYSIAFIDNTVLAVAVLTLTILVITSAWIGQMCGFYYGSSKILPTQPRNKWQLFKLACKFSWSEIFSKDSYKFLKIITTDSQNKAFWLLDKENMLDTEERRFFYGQLIATKPNDADQRIQVLVTLKQKEVTLTDQEMMTYFHAYASTQTHPIKGLIQLADIKQSIQGKDDSDNRSHYLDIIRHDIDVTLIKVSGGAVVKEFYGHVHAMFIKKAFVDLFSESSPCYPGIFRDYGSAHLSAYLKILAKFPLSAKDTVAVLMTLEGQKILSDGRSDDYWPVFLKKADWHYSAGLSAATLALAQAGLLHKRNVDNFATLCEHSAYSQDIANKIIAQKGFCSQKSYEEIIKVTCGKGELTPEESEISSTVPSSSLIISVAQRDSPIHNSIGEEEQSPSLTNNFQTLPNFS